MHHRQNQQYLNGGFFRLPTAQQQQFQQLQAPLPPPPGLNRNLLRIEQQLNEKQQQQQQRNSIQPIAPSVATAPPPPPPLPPPLPPVPSNNYHQKFIPRYPQQQQQQQQYQRFRTVTNQLNDNKTRHRNPQFFHHQNQNQNQQLNYNQNYSNYQQIQQFHNQYQTHQSHQQSHHHQQQQQNFLLDKQQKHLALEKKNMEKNIYDKIPTDILDDLASRFIVNIPLTERSDLIRICFQIEMAHWFYLDFFCDDDDDDDAAAVAADEDANDDVTAAVVDLLDDVGGGAVGVGNTLNDLNDFRGTNANVDDKIIQKNSQQQQSKRIMPMGSVPFTYAIFQHVPFLRNHIQRIDEIIQEFHYYKMSVPTYGCILMAENEDAILLVQSYNAKRAWGFPKGKVNEGENPVDCAVREVYEETGFDASDKIDKDLYIDAITNFQYSRLFVIMNVSRSTVFKPRTRKEIRNCEWFNIADLPINKRDLYRRLTMAKNQTDFLLRKHTFYMIMPLIRKIKYYLHFAYCRQHQIDAEHFLNSDSGKMKDVTAIAGGGGGGAGFNSKLPIGKHFQYVLRNHKNNEDYQIYLNSIHRIKYDCVRKGAKVEKVDKKGGKIEKKKENYPKLSSSATSTVVLQTRLSPSSSSDNGKDDDEVIKEEEEEEEEEEDEEEEEEGAGARAGGSGGGVGSSNSQMNTSQILNLSSLNEYGNFISNGNFDNFIENYSKHAAIKQAAATAAAAAIATGTSDGGVGLVVKNQQKQLKNQQQEKKQHENYGKNMESGIGSGSHKKSHHPHKIQTTINLNVTKDSENFPSKSPLPQPMPPSSSNFYKYANFSMKLQCNQIKQYENQINFNSNPEEIHKIIPFVPSFHESPQPKTVPQPIDWMTIKMEDDREQLLLSHKSKNSISDLGGGGSGDVNNGGGCVGAPKPTPMKIIVQNTNNNNNKKTVTWNDKKINECSTGAEAAVLAAGNALKVRDHTDKTRQDYELNLVTSQSIITNKTTTTTTTIGSLGVVGSMIKGTQSETVTLKSNQTAAEKITANEIDKTKNNLSVSVSNFMTSFLKQSERELAETVTLKNLLQINQGETEIEPKNEIEEEKKSTANFDYDQKSSIIKIEPMPSTKMTTTTTTTTTATATTTAMVVDEKNEQILEKSLNAVPFQQEIINNKRKPKPQLNRTDLLTEYKPIKNKNKSFLIENRNATIKNTLFLNQLPAPSPVLASTRPRPPFSSVTASSSSSSSPSNGLKWINPFTAQTKNPKQSKIVIPFSATATATATATSSSSSSSSLAGAVDSLSLQDKKIVSLNKISLQNISALRSTFDDVAAVVAASAAAAASIEADTVNNNHQLPGNSTTVTEIVSLPLSSSPTSRSPSRSLESFGTPSKSLDLMVLESAGESARKLNCEQSNEQFLPMELTTTEQPSSLALPVMMTTTTTTAAPAPSPPSNILREYQAYVDQNEHIQNFLNFRFNYDEIFKEIN